MSDDVIRQMAAFDDDALALLSSKGLVRRAGKDLEKSPPAIIERDAESVTLRVEDATVRFDSSGPAKARCSCRAFEVCRHVIVGCLWLRAQSVELRPQADAGEDVPAGDTPAIVWTDVVRWSGRRVALAGAELASEGALGTEGTWITVTFHGVGETVRLLPSRPFESVLCTCKSGICAHAVAGVLRFLRSRGNVIEPDATAAPSAPASQPPRTREEVLAAALRLFEEMLAIGLSQPNTSAHQRAATLAVSAHGVDLPRLSALLRSIAEDVALLLSRDARSDSQRLLLNLSRTFALSSALAVRPDLGGLHRSRYDEVRSLELHGLGASVWQTSSGYSGLTLLFWSEAAKDWFTWTEARPATQQFDPRSRLFGESPWTGAGSPEELSRSHIRLTHARRNGQNRLSGSSKTSVLCVEATRPRALDFGDRLYDDWSRLSDYAATILPIGLEVPRSSEAWVVVKPAEWGPPVFDAMRQQLRRPIFDGEGSALALCAQYREGDEDAVRWLESLNPSKAKVWAVIARVSVGAEILLWPVSALSDADPPILLAGLGGEAPVKGAPQERRAEEIVDIEDDESGELYPLVLQPVEELIGTLESVAEHGTIALSSSIRARLSVAALHNDAIGLASVARAVEALSESPEPNDRAARLLRARYLAEVARQAAGRASVIRPEGG